jgi:drug/metabolite transporter (DMT)-like permease
MNSSVYGEIIALLTTLSWTICVFPFTEAARRLGPNETNHLRLILAVLMLTAGSLIFFPLSFGDLFIKPTPENWLWLGLSGIVGLALGDYFGFTMYAILGTRVGSIFTTLSPGAALFLGYFMLRESVNTTGILGILVTVSGIIWLTLNKSGKSQLIDSEHGGIKKGIAFGILAALCHGIGLVFAKKGLQSGQAGEGILAVHATWIRMLAATLVIYSGSFLRGTGMRTIRDIRGNNRNGVWYAVAGTIFGPVIGVSLSLYAVSLIEVSVAQTIFSMVPVFVLPLAYAFYRERITAGSAFGVLIAVTGVILLIWRNEIESSLF